MRKLPVVCLIMLLCCAFTFNGHAQTIKGTCAIKNVETGIYLRIKDANTRNGTPPSWPGARISSTGSSLRERRMSILSG